MVQVWPTVDPFTDGAPALPTLIGGYYHFAPDDGATDWVFGALQDGYGPGTASIARTDPFGTGPYAGFLRREVYAADVRVSGGFRKTLVGGTLQDTAIGRHSVFARMSAGTAASAGTGNFRFAYWIDCSCYEGGVRDAGGGNLELFISRWDLGVETTLATSSAFPANMVSWVTGHLVRLTCETVAGDVELSLDVQAVSAEAAQGLFTTYYQPGGSGAKLTEAPGAGFAAGKGTVLQVPDGGIKKPGRADWMQDEFIGSPGAPADPVTVLSTTDDTGSKITAAGRCGFGGDREKTQNGTDQTVTTMTYFQVAEMGVSSDTIVWRDEWLRADPQTGVQRIDAFSTVGRDVGSDYSTDQAGASASEDRFEASGAGSGIQASAIDMGNAPDMPGDSTVPIVLAASKFGNVIPSPPAASVLQLTIAVWADLLDSRDGNELFSTLDVSADDGIAFGWRDEGSGNAAIEVRIGNGATITSYKTPTFTAASYVGGTYCWVVTWNADSDGPGAGRLRVYRGRLSAATLLAEFTVPAADNPSFTTAENMIIGERLDDPTPGTDADRYLNGQVDRVTVFYTELASDEVSLVCDENASDAELEALGAVHGLDFDDTADAGGFHEFYPWLPTSLPQTTANAWLQDDGVALVPGLVFSPADSILPVLHARPAESDYQQSREATITLPASASRGGIMLRASGFIGAGNGYLILVGQGSPAEVSVYRYVNGERQRVGKGGAGNAQAVTRAVPFTVQATVQRVAPEVPDSAAQVSLLIAGTAFLLDALPGFGVSTGSDGSLIDAGSDRVLGGLQTGLAVITPTGTSVTIDDWTVAAIPSSPGPNAAPSAVIPGELDGFGAEVPEAFGNLRDSLPVPLRLRRISRGSRLDLTMIDGHRRRRGLDFYEPRAYVIEAILTAAELDTLLAFHEAHLDGAVAFYFDPVEGDSSGMIVNEPGGWWFFGGESARLRPRRTPGGVYAVAFTIEEAVNDGRPTP